MARPVATVRPVKRDGRWVFLPTCALSLALCRLAKRPYLDTEDIKLIVHPDLIDIRVCLHEPNDRDITHWLTYPRQH